LTRSAKRFSSRQGPSKRHTSSMVCGADPG
jgi:hypothetical protein